MDTKETFFGVSQRSIGVLLLISFLAGGVGGAFASRFFSADTVTISGDSGAKTEQRTYVEESQSIAAIERVSPAVISIVASKDLQTFRQNLNDPFSLFENDPFFREFFGPSPFGQPQQERGQPQQQEQEPETQRQRIGGGTGFIVSEDGLALTNKHVVQDPDADYTALLADGNEYELEVIDRDPLNDLAVVQLHEKKEGDGFGAKPSGLPFADLGDSSVLKVGQRVFAIGYARGEYQNSVTSGIISATERQIAASNGLGGTVEVLSGLLQTDAAINFGNSGGPLINLEGQVIGVNTAIDAGAAGIGFAIPVDEVKPVLASVQKNGKIVRPMLGVRHVILTKESAEEMGLEGLEYGALLVGDRTQGERAVVPGGPAEKAGLRIDDVILEVDGEKITIENTLQAVVRRHAPGDKLQLLVWREGKTVSVPVELGEFREE